VSLIDTALNNLNVNSLSKNFGNFDRNYWHYKVIDFPSGMMQTYSYALALCYKNKYPNLEHLYKNPKIIKWVLASLSNTTQITNTNGSIDDYYPYEQAVGATTFVIINFIKTIRMLNIDKSKYENYIIKVGKFISKSNETGILSNHKAAEILSLVLIADTYKTSIFEDSIKKKFDELYNSYDEEGWFEEYGGCDLGYLTVTISRLTDIYRLRPNQNLFNKIKKCIHFSLENILPDYSIGGNYNSRSTKINFTDGFAKFYHLDPKSSYFIDSVNKQISLGNNSYYKDDQIACHQLISYLETIINLKKYVKKDLSKLNSIIKKDSYFKSSGFIKKNFGNFDIRIGLHKGGLFNLYKKNKLFFVDSGISLEINKTKYLSNGQFKPKQIKISDNTIFVTQDLYPYKEQFMNIFKLITLRFIMLFIGRFFPNCIRYVLQKILIIRKSKSQFKLHRKFIFKKNHLIIEDKIVGTKIGKINLIENVNTSHIVMSNVLNSSYFLYKDYIISKKDLSIIRKIY
jgi:hypothetical protein